MNHIEAMKQALDALQGSGYYDTTQQREAITALRQAIQEAEKQEQWTPDDMAHRPGGLSMEDEPDLSEQGRNRSAVLVNNIQAMVDAGLPFLDALETTLKVYDHPTKPQEDTAYRPGGLSMEQKPVAWWNPDESGLSFQKLRGDWQPLYAAPVHAIDTLEKHVDETAKDKHDPNVYGDGNVYRGQRSKDSTTKTLYYTDQEPVAWRTFDGEGNYEFRDYEMNEAYQEEWSKRNPKHQGWVEPLYAAPPKAEKQEPVACQHKRYTVDEHEQTGTCIDRGAWSDVPDATKWVDELRGDEDLDAPPNSTTDVAESTDSLSTLLWRDLKTDRQRADWLRLGMGYQTGVVAAAIQQELAMAYERLVGFQKIHAALEQPEREWVGLTDEEIFDVIRSLCIDNETAEMLIHVSMDEYRAIEAKLKGKNN